MKASSLKRKFIIFVIIIILPIATSNVISLIISSKINNNYKYMLNKMSTSSDIKKALNDSFFNFTKYINTKSNDCKKLYDESYDRAINNITLLNVNSNIDSKYILRDLENLLKSYKISGDEALRLYDNEAGIDVYYDKYVSTKEIFSYCNTFISKLSDSYLDYNNNIYSNLKEKERYIYIVLVAYIITAVLVSSIYALIFLKNILDKLNELVYSSQKVAEGNFTYSEGKKTYIYELDILSEAFKTMISSIKKHVNSLKENAQLERKLQDEEMKLLKYQNALKQSQLKVLQAQINPHFLFNTLNCINQTAMKENAEKTESLITSVSGILRYSISMMDRNATLDEEIKVVKQYMFIQKLRFEDRVKFSLKVETDLSKIIVPGMTLQPFVENAFIHGIEPKEEGGDINIEIKESENRYIVLIEDTGCGIDEDILSKITSDHWDQEHIGHTTGMGIKSVVERILLLYDEKDIFSIESNRGVGTKIYLRIPKRELNKIC